MAQSYLRFSLLVKRSFAVFKAFLDLKIIMPRCACASEVYGSVFVCVCVSVCVDRYSCSRMNQVQVRVSIGF